MRKGTTAATLVALLGLFALTGCGEKTNEEKMDDAAENMKDAADDAANDANDAADDMKNALEEK